MKASRRKVLLANGSTPVPYFNPRHAAQAGSEEQVQQQGQPTTAQTEASVHLLLPGQPAPRVLAEAAGAAPARDKSSRLLHSDRVANNETDTRHSTGAAWDASNNKAVFALLRTLYSIHVSGMAARGVMEFVHVSKAGGTSTCMAAGEDMHAQDMAPRYSSCWIPPIQPG